MRTYERHENGKGTIMNCTIHGKPTSVFIADEAYRGGRSYWGYSEPLFCEPSEFPFMHKLYNEMWDGALDQLDFGTVYSSEHSTSLMCKSAEPGVPNIAQLVRSINIGLQLDVPSIDILARIYCDRHVIDSMDPTIDKSNNLHIRFKHGCWSSTEYCGYYGWLVINHDLFNTTIEGKSYDIYTVPVCVL